MVIFGPVALIYHRTRHVGGYDVAESNDLELWFIFSTSMMWMSMAQSNRASRPDQENAFAGCAVILRTAPMQSQESSSPKMSVNQCSDAVKH
jgi:hypothetical protein